MKLADFKYESIKMDLSKHQKIEAILERRKWIRENEEGLSIGVKNVLTSLLDFIQWMDWPLSTVTDKASYETINQIFHLSTFSAQSNDAERNFYRKANRLLDQNSDAHHRLNTVIQPLINEQQIAHSWQLECFDPAYKNAVDGMAASFFAFGLMLTMLEQDPRWFFLSSIFLIAKVLPSLSSVDSINDNRPSILGDLIYRNDNLRALGNTLNETVLPSGLPLTALGLFDTANRVARATVQGLVEPEGRAVGVEP
ncbi:hypothetical protein [Legionella sp. W05-934-2]|jgi:hypothetical protein|uniref:hypothetical protein n=1 Tax=Legionella sp. W05-934-2 TaxID=1198649 RepID=UPI0034619DBA